ncbi:MAG: type III pantothenate kinase [Candidatus Abyssobacteria bacterium SURF_17]|uniref:Type III pantothenate kinase n=1 Tax=Candidatus Abyssobacteria bacterium SURF_17 TaxID=2093361 RepID=A0A419F6B0_9BACT|nr:MAG: type III pantothenate kinase [Candidatus Abyssubacteria bacterium SURF_17]
MLLVIDVGNTQMVMGVYDNTNLLVSWRVSTDIRRSGDEFWVVLRNLFREADLDTEAVKGVCISSVVPPLQGMLEEVCDRYFKCEPISVEPGVKTGLSILYDNPREVGADRIVNAVAGINLYGAPLIIVDFGTATTFDAVSAKAQYLGGAIFPGITISAEALFQRTAKLPRVELTAPKSVIGKDTDSSIRSGLIYGYAEMVDGMVKRIRKEMEGLPKVIATGGLAAVIAKYSQEIQEVNHMLTLVGLRIIYEKNRA